MNPVGMESSALARRCGRALAIATLLALAALSVFPPASPATRLVVSTTLGVMLVLTALALAFRGRLLEWARRHGDDAWIARHRTPATLATGAHLDRVKAHYDPEDRLTSLYDKVVRKQ